MKDVINLVRIIINGFSDTCTEVELFDLIFLSKTLQSYDNIMKLQTKGGKKDLLITPFRRYYATRCQAAKIEKRISALVSQNPFPFL
jgi:hypothetical protein